ncbi:MAG: ribosome maturation factor RimM [Ignavibacteriaceae bacterium]|nr:ribosome maturation factor RimM [Ignavibacteriaceae bacterium]
MPEYFLIAKIDSVYGKNGFVKISSYTDFPDRFNDLEKVYLDFFDDKKKFLIEETKQIKNSIILKFKNFDNDKDVQILIGKEVFVEGSDVVKLPKDYFFVHDLVGCKVIKEGVKFGSVIDVLNYPANSVYVVKDINGLEVLIPAVAYFIDDIDIDKKIIILKPGINLYDDED